MSAYLDHYIKYGFAEKRDTGGEVNLAEYADAYSDISATLGKDILKIYKHYETAGKKEGRTAGTVAAKEAAKKAAAATSSTTTTSSTPSTPTPPVTYKTLSSITTPVALTGIANETPFDTIVGRLPSTVKVNTTDGSIYNASVVWNTTTFNTGSYVPATSTVQSFVLNGAVTLPSNVRNASEPIALTTTISVRVEATGATQITSVTPATAYTATANGITKSALQSELASARSTLATDPESSPAAPVTWDVANSTYNPNNTALQTFEVSGRIALPEGYYVSNDSLLNTSIEVTVPAVAHDGYTANSTTLAEFPTEFEVDYGTDEEDALDSLPNTAWVVGTNGLPYPVSVEWDWANEVTYAAETPGTYNVTGTVTATGAVPSTIDIASNNTITGSHIKVNAGPTYVGIYANQTGTEQFVKTKSVAYNSTEAAAIALLPTSAWVKDSNDDFWEVTVAWTCDTYQKGTADNYVATGVITEKNTDEIPNSIILSNITDGNITVRVAEAHASYSSTNTDPASPSAIDSTTYVVHVNSGTNETSCEEAIQSAYPTCYSLSTEGNYYTVNITWDITSFNGEDGTNNTVTGTAECEKYSTATTIEGHVIIDAAEGP